MENENSVTGSDIFTQGWEGDGAADGREAEPLPEETAPDGADAGNGTPSEGTPQPAPAPFGGRDGEIRQFVLEHPGVMPEAIPEEVWRRVRAGESLPSAYDRYEAARLREENRRLETELQSRRQAESNRRRSAGSQTGAGAGARDPFDDGWELEW